MDNFYQTIFNHNQIGTRPALSMSNPVCYSAAVVMGTNIMHQPNVNDQLNANDFVNGQRILEGQLVTPGAESLPSSSLSLPSSSSSSSSNVTLSNQHPSQPAPTLSPEEYFTKLHEALSLEPKFQPSLYLPQESHVSILFPRPEIFSFKHLSIFCEFSRKFSPQFFKMNLFWRKFK